MNRPKKNKPKTAQRASVTHADPQPAGDPVRLEALGNIYSPEFAASNARFRAALERGRAALEASRQAREPSPADVARKARLDAFEKSLHGRAMGILGKATGREIESLIAMVGRMEKETASILRKIEERGLPKSPAAPPVLETSASQPMDAIPAVPRKIERGKFCDQVIDEVRRIRNLCLGNGKSVAEVQHEHPEWAVWKVRESLTSEDQDTFNHPNRWGPTTGYAEGILGKTKGVSTHTINSWAKAYRKSLRTKKG